MLPRAGEFVGALSVDMNRRIGRRDLLYFADELTQRRADCRFVRRRPRRFRRREFAFGVAGAAGDVEGNFRFVPLGLSLDVVCQFRRRTHPHHQYACRERVQGARVTDARFPRTATAHTPHHRVTRHACGLMDI